MPYIVILSPVCTAKATALGVDFHFTADAPTLALSSLHPPTTARQLPTYYTHTTAHNNHTYTHTHTIRIQANKTAAALLARARMYLNYTCLLSLSVVSREHHAASFTPSHPPSKHTFYMEYAARTHTRCSPGPWLQDRIAANFIQNQPIIRWATGFRRGGRADTTAASRLRERIFTVRTLEVLIRVGGTCVHLRRCAVPTFTHTHIPPTYHNRTKTESIDTHTHMHKRMNTSEQHTV